MTAPARPAAPTPLDEAAIDRASGGSAVSVAQTMFHAGDGADAIFTTESGDRVWANGGNDTVHAGGGNDAVWGGAGDDLILGGDGHDRMWGEAGNDTLVGGAGDDNMFGGDGDDTFRWAPGQGSDYMAGGAGTNTLEMSEVSVEAVLAGLTPATASQALTPHYDAESRTLTFLDATGAPAPYSGSVLVGTEVVSFKDIARISF